MLIIRRGPLRLSHGTSGPGRVTPARPCCCSHHRLNHLEVLLRQVGLGLAQRLRQRGRHTAAVGVADSTPECLGVDEVGRG